MNTTLSSSTFSNEYNIPSTWTITKLENVVQILDNLRKPINAKEREIRKGNIPYYGATGQVGWIDNFLFDEELVLLGEDGAPFLESDKNKAYVINGKSWVNNHAHVLRAINDLTINSYVCYFLNVFDYHGYVTGTTRLKLNQSSMRDIPIPLAPINEQKRIVSKLEELFTKLDAGIEYLKRNQILLKKYRQSILKFAFEGKLTEKWRKTNDIKSDNGISIQIKNIETSLLPKSWKWISLNDICQRITDGEHFRPKTKATGIPFLSAKDITDKGVLFDNVLYVDENDANKFRKRCNPEFGDILIVSRGATIGRTCIVNTSKIFCLLGSVILLKLSTIANNKFINYMIKSPYCQKKLMNLSGSTAQQAIYLRDIKNVLIPFPPIEEQKIISDTLDSIFSIYENIINNIKIMVEQSNNLRKSLLQDAFEGKLAPQDPTDEPAEMLLEKIKKQSESILPLRKEKSKITKKKSIYNDNKQMRLM